MQLLDLIKFNVILSNKNELLFLLQENLCKFKQNANFLEEESKLKKINLKANDDRIFFLIF